ncbi:MULTISPECIES: NUDIX hydrolase [Kitasatospora]|uniref:Nudix hydrolase domain-containing protein n=1 Tax=Kitasatospora setae (strain ATCC 33774 / DSM 43861 / JCM 3304 / KCC A-0304 / NBRC 14216 / KM-6054) TaxID=452652 RepID=E4NG48_KITSK|nr:MULTISPECIES: NUDIX hydrolase [Kitasatospora]BAJ30478.1 hypothetical protein KSE_46970 [Kitasatospora setae KM-6054]
MTHAEIPHDGQPRRRVGCLTLILDQEDRVLFSVTTYKQRPILPGGAAGKDERFDRAAARELREETGLVRRLSHFFAVDQTPENGETGSNEGLNLVFDGGVITDEELAALAVPEAAAGEIAGHVWLREDEFDGALLPATAARVRAVLAARKARQLLPLLHHGVPVSELPA